MMTIMNRRYEVGERIASGGMADVFVARDTTLGRQVAIKRLKAELDTTAAKERFALEAFALAGFSHPNAVAVYDAGEDDDGPYIVMELVDGPTLAQHLRESGPLSVEEATAISAQVLAALGAAHANGIVHRDVKPANVLLTDDRAVKLADFGIAKAMSDSDSDLTLHGQIIGTPKYLAPERTVGRDATPQSDLYSVAVIMYEMVVGSPPFDGDSSEAMLAAQRHAPVPSVRTARPDVPVTFAAVVERGLAKEPGARFESAEAMRAALIAGSAGVDIDDEATTAADLTMAADTTAAMPIAARPAPMRSPPATSSAGPVVPRAPGAQRSAHSRRWWIIVPLVLAAVVLGGLALAGGGGGGDGGPLVRTVVTDPPVTAAQTVPPTLPPTVVPQIPQNLNQLVSLLGARPNAYGVRTTELRARLQSAIAGADKKAIEGLIKDLEKWMKNGEITPAIGTVAINLLKDFADAQSSDHGAVKGNEEQGD